MTKSTYSILVILAIASAIGTANYVYQFSHAEPGKEQYAIVLGALCALIFFFMFMALRDYRRYKR